MQDNETLLKECLKIIDSFLSDPKLSKEERRGLIHLVDFYEPVKWKELGLLDYLQFIKNPMDLTTVKVSPPFFFLSLEQTAE
jgi:singapore isolate B (sub-type 7) whole genome shotgun sequence assembly, scaffold_4